MSGILRLESLTKGNTLKQGDKTPLKYRLFDADGDTLNIAGKSAKVRLVYPDFLTIGYEKDGLIVAQDDTVIFTIDSVIPSRIYHVEIIVDDKFIFPSRADESKFTVDKSSLGADANIIEIVGKDVLINAVKSQVDTELQPLVTSLQSAEQAETERATAESSRASAEEQREIDHANRSAEMDGKADKVVLKNEVINATPSINGGVRLDSDGESLKIEGTSGTYSGISYVDRSLSKPAGDKLYLFSEVQVHNKLPIDVRLEYRDGVGINLGKLINNIVIGDKYILSGVIDSRGAYAGSYMRVFFNYGSNLQGSIIEVFKSMFIDLTETFGAGNEPTKEEMDELINAIGHIDGTYRLDNKDMLSYLMNSDGDKANIKQEEWQILPLVNGWTSDEPYWGLGVRFYKDTLNRVHFEGYIDGASSTDLVIGVLPIGYRPNRRIGAASNDVGARIDFLPDGAIVVVPVGASGFISTSFMAE